MSIYKGLDSEARRVLREAGVTPAAYIEAYFPGAKTWHGDKCGCVDDRCMEGCHHFDWDPCYCLQYFLKDIAPNEVSLILPRPRD